MMFNRITITVLLVLLIFIAGCGETGLNSRNITLNCVRDADTIQLKITNNSKDTLYIPLQYIGTYNTEGDTIFLEMIDKPRFNRNTYYRYSNLFPFEVYLTKPVLGIKPDSAITIVNQTYFFNQFLVRPFTIVLPHSTHVSSCVFHVPQRPGKLQAVYYTKPFHIGNKDPIVANYHLEDWIKFDSLNARYITCEIANRVYLTIPQVHLPL